MFVKLPRLEMTRKKPQVHCLSLKKGWATFREIILSVATQRSLLELEQLVHDVSINLCLISTFLPGITNVPQTHET